MVNGPELLKALADTQPAAAAHSLLAHLPSVASPFRLATQIPAPTLAEWSPGASAFEASGAGDSLAFASAVGAVVPAATTAPAGAVQNGVGGAVGGVGYVAGASDGGSGSTVGGTSASKRKRDDPEYKEAQRVAASGGVTYERQCAVCRRTLASRLRQYGSHPSQLYFESAEQLCYDQRDGPPQSGTRTQ